MAADADVDTVPPSPVAGWVQPAAVAATAWAAEVGWLLNESDDDDGYRRFVDAMTFPMFPMKWQFPQSRVNVPS